MRICLVAHGFPPIEFTGVENYTAALAAALAAAGHEVEVFTVRTAGDLPDLSLRREERDGYAVSWLTANSPPEDQEAMLDPPGIVARFAEFLERERPEIVHFQHVIKLGVSLITEAHQRGIPTLYTAHDYYPICHRFTLMRPDLERCEVLGDSEACSRCDLALSYLNLQDGLGDYQQGVLPDQLAESENDALAQILRGDPRPAGFSETDQASFRARRRALDLLRASAFDELDLILAPTRFLAERLVAGGLDAAKIEVLPYGAETSALTSVAAPGGDSTEKTRRMRFGYLGGLSKHKGVHVLLDAFASLSSPADLSIWGSSSDAEYVRQLEAQAKRVGARWQGVYGRDELARCLEQIDVVVVPSIWVENYPFVIREAFAARRPVLASNVGALPESVRDGVDGLLFEPGSATSLAASMQRLIEEEGLLEKLARNIQKVKSIDTQVGELVPIYERLLRSDRAGQPSTLPAHLRASAKLYDELSAMPLRQLFRQVFGELERVQSTLTGTNEPRAVPLAEALAPHSRTQVLLRDLKHETEWLRDSLSSLRAEIDWRTQESISSEDELSWLRQTTQTLKSEVDWLRRQSEENRREVEWLGEQATTKQREAEWLRGLLEEKKREAAWQSETIAGQKTENDWLRECAQEHERTLAHLREQRRLIAREVDRARELLEAARPAHQLAASDAAPLISPDVPGAALLDELPARLAERNQDLRDILADLGHRRAEMTRATAEASGFWVRLFLGWTKLVRRAKKWKADANDTEQDNADA